MKAQLTFWSWEDEPGERGERLEAELLEGLHRILLISDQLQGCIDPSDAAKTLRLVQYHLENFLGGVYAMRERIVALAAHCSSRKDLSGLLKRRRSRAESLKILESFDPILARAVEGFLGITEADIGLRNFHIHDTFLMFGLWTTDDVYDPFDALIELEGKALAKRRLANLLVKEAIRIAEEQDAKAQRIRDAVEPIFVRKSA